MYELKDIEIKVPGDVEFILKTIREAGYEAYIVGGCVRDSILGRQPEDWDITTSALPEQVKGLFRNTVDTGIEHGTVMVLKGGTGYEVTTYRIDGKYSDNRHPEHVTFTPSLEEDLKRRDFTVNAFAYNPETGIVDLFGGIDDLNNRIIRAVGEPRRRFDEDALRIMRAVRFSAQLSFEIEPATREAIREFGPRLKDISAERIRVEFEKTLWSDNPSYVNKYAQLGLGEYVIPEVSSDCFKEENCKVYEAILKQKMPEDKALLLAAFFENAKADKVSAVMRQMTFDNKTRLAVCAALAHRSDELPSGRAEIKKYMFENGDDVTINTFNMKLAEAIAGKDAAAEDTCRKAAYGAADIIAAKEPYKISMLAVNGSDLMAAGIPAGVLIGEILTKLTYMVINDPQDNTKERLLEIARKLS